MARRRATLVLIAFMAAVMAVGGGGVTAPWMPRPAADTDASVLVAHVGPVVSGVWGRLRIE